MWYDVNTEKAGIQVQDNSTQLEILRLLKYGEVKAHMKILQQWSLTVCMKPMWILLPAKERPAVKSTYKVRKIFIKCIF